MKISIDHARNPLLGWDVKVSVLADGQQSIARVEVLVNGFPQVRDTLSTPLNSWEQEFTQKGIFPGDNKVEVLVLDQDDEETRAVQKWS